MIDGRGQWPLPLLLPAHDQDDRRDRDDHRRTAEQNSEENNDVPRFEGAHARRGYQRPPISESERRGHPLGHVVFGHRRVDLDDVQVETLCFGAEAFGEHPVSLDQVA